MLGWMEGSVMQRQTAKSMFSTVVVGVDGDCLRGGVLA